MRDRHAWSEVRRANAGWLAPWEATPPRPVQGEVSFRTMVRHLGAEAREGRMLPFVITYDGQLVGQLTVGSIAWGSLCSAHIGYWVDSRFAGRGIVPLSVAMATDYCFTDLGMHRMEINIRPENAASLRVVEKLGFRSEGVRLRYLHIDGDWRDHLSFALTADEVPEGLRARWRAHQSQQSHE
jgi:ribosomal-protein-alanine N-acetyltransferase